MEETAAAGRGSGHRDDPGIKLSGSVNTGNFSVSEKRGVANGFMVSGGNVIEGTYSLFTIVIRSRDFTCGEHWGRLGNGPGSYFRARDKLPGVLLAQQAGHQLGVHGVTGAFRNHVTDQRAAEHGKIPNQVQKFVPAKLVREA